MLTLFCTIFIKLFTININNVCKNIFTISYMQNGKIFTKMRGDKYFAIRFNKKIKTIT